MDRILFGDNQFFGVNHMSEEKARSQSLRFKTTGAIVGVLDTAYDIGIKTFMCTTHDRIAAVCDHFRANADRYADYEFFPCMPYAHKYANAVTDLGMLGAVKKFAPGGILGAAFRGGKAVATGNFMEVMKMMVDAEMKMFHDLNTPVIFIQNVMTDLLLGLGMREPFITFTKHVKEKYNAEPAFITMNLPMLLDMLDDCSIENPIVCSSINKIGFRMCGGTKLYEKTLAERKFRPIAMSILASGGIGPTEAVEYVCGLKSIESIVFGASTKAHIQHTKELIEQYS